MEQLKAKLSKVSVALGSRCFYLFVICLFIFESIWIAFSALYPQAFDENFHFGLIKVYSHYWLPFLSHQPANANAYGAVARDPSYLYHYLMSFPYRFLAFFVHSQTAQVISLRILNIGLFLIGLILFKKVLRRVGVSSSLTNLILLLFILIPIVPQLAAQINYDDLLFPLTALTCLTTFNLIDQINKKEPTFKTLFLLMILLVFTSLVKYAFLPIALAVGLFSLFIIYRNYKGNLTRCVYSLTSDFKRQSKWLRIVLISLLLVGIGMFIQRDGYNLVHYHTFDPNCAKVLSGNDCKAYSVWYADYTRHQQVLSGQVTLSYDNIARYTAQWFYWMWYRLFFAVNGPNSNFASADPLPIPSITAIVVAVLGVGSLVRWRRTIFSHKPYIAFLFTACIIYCIALFLQGYSSYRYTAVLENMNGRYLIPILLPGAAIIGLAISRSLKRSVIPKAISALVVIILFFEGGGLLTFILRSDSTWYWDNKTINKINNDAQKVAKHVVVVKTLKSAKKP